MTNKELLDIYREYLISSFGQTTGTGLATLLGKAHLGSAELWDIVKPSVWPIQAFI